MNFSHGYAVVFSCLQEVLQIFLFFSQLSVHEPHEVPQIGNQGIAIAPSTETLIALDKVKVSFAVISFSSTVDLDPTTDSHHVNRLLTLNYDVLHPSTSPKPLQIPSHTSTPLQIRLHPSEPFHIPPSLSASVRIPPHPSTLSSALLCTPVPSC